MNSGETANTWIDALSASFAGVQVSKKTKRFSLAPQTQALALYDKDPCFPVKTGRLELISPTNGARARETPVTVALPGLFFKRLLRKLGLPVVSMKIRFDTSRIKTSRFSRGLNLVVDT